MAAAEAVTYDFYQSDLFVPTWSGWESLAASNVKQQTDGSSCTSCQGGKMRIAIIAHLKYPISEPFAGGLEMHTHMLARSLRERGHDVTLFASTRSDPALGVEASAMKPHSSKLALTRLTMLLSSANTMPILG